MNYLAYIDPGTGSMMFTIIIGIVTTLFFALRGLLIKFKFGFHKGSGKGSKNKLPIVIFTDSKRYWNVFKPICDEMERRGIDGEYWTASPDDPALQEQYQHIRCLFIGEGNRAFAKLNVMNAHICLATTPGLDVIQWKRSKNTDYYAHTSHALDDGTMYRMFALDFYDCLLVSGENMVEPVRELERIRELPAKDIIVTGVTYMDELKFRWDALQKEKEKKAKERIEQGLSAEEPHETTILCAPSWGPNSIFNRYGEKFLKALVDTGYHIVIRPHPQTPISDPELLKDLQMKFPANDQVEWNYDNDNFEILSRSDLLISDFSGITWDFCYVFDRPHIFADTHFELELLDADWLDRTPWILETLGKIGRQLREEDFPHMKQIIEDVLSDESYKRQREITRDESWAYRGEATVRTVDFLEKKLKELQENGEAEA